MGIFENLEKALAFDSQDVEGVDRGPRRAAGALRHHDGPGPRGVPALWAGKTGDKAVEAVLEHFRDKEARDEF